MKSAIALAALLFAVPLSASEAPILAAGTHRLQQVAITTSDLDRAIAFYRDTIGLDLMFVANGMAFFDLAGTRLMVAYDSKRAVADRPTSILYLDVDDFAASVKRLAARKVVLDGGVETVQTTASGTLKLQQFTDPDGNALAVMGFVPS